MVSKVFISIPFVVLFFAQFVVAIWPVPISYEHGDEVVWIGHGTGWRYEAPAKLDRAIKARVERAIERAKKQVLNNQLVPWKFHPRGSNFEPSLEGKQSAQISKIVIKQLKADNSKAPKYGDLDESYELYMPGSSGYGKDMEKSLVDLTEGGNSRVAVIVANNSAGVIHALQTLVQLFYGHSAGGVYSPLAPVSIKDKPKYEHRGVNLDTSRQWYPKEAILKVLDGLSYNKMNRFHFHVTDSQSWPLEVPALPELAAEGAYYKGLTYTPRDIQDIYQYGEDRGIQIIMEIDMPGHTASIGHAYPDLITGQNVQPNWPEVAAQPPSGHLKLNNEKVEAFLTKLFNDVLPRLSQYTTYFHTGGDEVNKNIYLLDEGVKSNEHDVIKPYLERFLKHAHGLVRKNGATPVVWEEMVLEWGVDLPKDTIVQVWLGDAAVKEATGKGYRVIAGSYQYWYLDCGNGQWLDWHGTAGFPYNDWCGPKKSWRLVYTHDPAAGLSPEQAKLVLGGEVHIWSEQIDMHSIDSTLWPRAGAAAEVLWSGRQDAEGKNRTFPDASPRLAELRERMVLWGIDAAPIMQTWCHQNEGGCEFPA